ncbi:MAG TPA: terminase small subunit [Stellaceae bacterium]|nr:terminase small subunit [Stellaceae bacterium]
MGKLKKLSDREQQFVNEYLVDFNANHAARRVGLAPTKTNYKIKHRKAVAAAIEKAIAERSKRTRITADRVLREYARIAFADIRSFAKEREGASDLETVAALSDDEAAAVAELSGTSDGKGLRVKLHDKKRALDALARHLGLFDKKQEPVESPSVRAERIRELIRARHARLIEPSGTE